MSLWKSVRLHKGEIDGEPEGLQELLKTVTVIRQLKYYGVVGRKNFPLTGQDGHQIPHAVPSLHQIVPAPGPEGRPLAPVEAQVLC